ncbi:cell wall hydrolase [Anaeropeptidivorans aminofermentans]|uniref:cell wall hydrolase n=1 Tax=Anaeropeptidivorans aminofermentans TaxID=2934315 RepID=UPI0038CC1CAA
MFPNSLYAVFFQPNQLELTRIGAYAKAIPSNKIITSVIEALNNTNYSQGALYFRAIKGITPTCWHKKTLIKLYDYGGHRFYK